MDIMPGILRVFTEPPITTLDDTSHNERVTTLLHPVTGLIPKETGHLGSDMSAEAGGKRPTNKSSENSSYTMVSDTPPDGPSIRPSRPSKKGIAFGKRSNSMKRNPNAEVIKTGWLYKQASSGVKQWNKRWFVLVDRCLFYYKDEKEEGILGSIPLLSFRISPVQASDNISRKHTFKVTVCCVGDVSLHNSATVSRQAEHAGIRTYFFSAESKEEQESWVRMMGEASQVQNPPTPRLERQDSENIPPMKDRDPETRSRGEGDGRGSDKLERRLESRKEPLTKVNGMGAPTDRPSDLEPPRHLPEGERPPQPNGWGFMPSPGRPASTAFPEGNGQRRGNLPRSYPEKVAQRQSSMSQLQQWVNLRRAAAPTEEVQSPSRYFPGPHRIPEYYSQYPSQYPDGYPYYTPAGSRPDSICSMPAFDRGIPPWGVEDKRHILRNGAQYHREFKDPGYGRPADMWGVRPTLYYHDVDAACGSLRRLSLQSRSRSVPRSPSQGTYNARPRVYSPVRSPSARFDTVIRDESFGEPAAYSMRRSISSPKYDYLGDRRPVPAGIYSYNYPASPPLHDKMVSPYADPYREALQSYKINEQDTDKLLGRLCEQHKVVREQDRLVQQLRAEKESLESALMGTHQEMEMFGNQTAFPEKLLHRKESLQNQLISIRVELSQATTALNNSSMEYEALEGEVSALHDALWEQLNLNIQNELMNRHIQREIWRIQDVMEGLRKNNPSRGTDTAKHRVVAGPSATFSSNSPASPLSSASLTSPLSPFSLISGSQGSPTKQTTSEDSGPPRPPLPLSYTPLDSPPTVPPPPGEGRFQPWPYPVSHYWPHGELKLSLEPFKRESPQLSSSLPPEGVAALQSRTDSESEKQLQAVNKVGIVPPRTKSPSEEGTIGKPLVVRRGGSHALNGNNTRERPKSALFPSEVKSKMSVEEQIDRMKRHQSGSMKDKRRSLQLPANQQLETGTTKPVSYRVVRRHRSIHEVDISDLEAALRSQEPQHTYESPRDEIARLRKMDLEPQGFSVDISRELSTPDKVLIPERYIEMEPDSPLSPEEQQEKQRKVERIKTLIAKSSLQNVMPLSDSELELPADSESQLQEQEKRIELSCALAAEASRRGRLLSALCATPSPPTSPTSPAPPTLPSSPERSALGGNSSGSDSAGEYGANIMCV
ncbi:pleckstrin homology domain-containing family A member 6 isoform X1 [Bombina bombina]|uniref:pleckstrin homology domain-containing family A member 6 isoform X1 n=3 Tax=Bombina bombina TaxID=8345 RepID=UPI00235AF0BF|nr:pleckstrin homology domain-containing family A member 6 isoform X1 [Bombina bombina]XP_053562673.1 pleckstrin homology domain-containing family A member 6 isoform X1 [Bombina bombina]